ncbi:MAG: hypothetical protein ACLQDL_14840 [Spirochaetia bacterium]
MTGNSSFWFSGWNMLRREMSTCTVRTHALRISKQFGYDPSVSRYLAFKSPSGTERLSS